MSQQIVLSGTGTQRFENTLSLYLNRSEPRVIAVAAAFVSIWGVQKLIQILRRCGNPDCRIIAGTDNFITHPGALYLARDQGWEVRLGRKPEGGIFHPKMVVAGQSFSRNGNILGLCCTYVGSSNLSYRGFVTSVECGHFTDAESCPISSSESFAELWRRASPANDTALRHYAARFAEHSRRRTVSELTDLGVNDSQPVPSETAFLRELQPPSRSALGPDFAIAAWAGLQSFTGEYRFQIEFPKNAGRVINQLIQDRVQANGRIEVYCPDDETIRIMQYKFYPNNGMSRLNVPNDTPGVTWAREHKVGIAIVEQGLPGGAPLRIQLLKPGSVANEIVGRSVALGTWGKTSTRSYGWY